MEILCVPERPTFPVPRTPFVAKERWDGGPFLSYPHRKQWLQRVLPSIRYPGPAPEVPYLEMMYPTPKAENEDFYQTWLYFGLISECLGLNEDSDDVTGPDRTETLAKCAALYESCVVMDSNAGYVNGASVFEVLQPFLRDLAEEKDRVVRRLGQLHKCFYLTYQMINNIHSEFDENIKFSISAMAEVVCTAIYSTTTSLSLKGIPIEDDAKRFYFPWYRLFLAEGSTLESQMIAAGWCASEIERIRHSYQGIGSIHFLSRLDHSTPQRDHSTCTKLQCKAFQIDLASYKLAHAEDCLDCPEYEVDIDEVQRVLRETKTFPVLRFEESEDGSVGLAVEARTPDIDYVALSHVWADGLGNPRANSIQQCQVARLRKLVINLQGSSATGEPYRLWIDTLCCPVELSGKLIALERITDVYRKAKHVLVVDSSMSSYTSEDKLPAETMLRIFGTSAWMRRLWTLQEGALAQSLRFQFADHAVDDLQLTQKVFEMGGRDPRHMRFWHDITNELRRLHNLNFAGQDGSYSFKALEIRLTNLQWSMYFRTVTVPSDEALCLATLLAVDIRPIAITEGHAERMALLWKSVGSRYEGFPSRVIFFEDNAIGIPGYRWAPFSLLPPPFKTWMDVSTKGVRFGSSASDQVVRRGNVTDKGLEVVFPGARIESRPLAPNLPLHPWEGIIKSLEDMVYAKHEVTGRWVRLCDWVQTKAFEVFSEDEKREWHRKANMPICRATHRNNSALIHDPVEAAVATYTDTIHSSLLVSIEDDSGEALGARKELLLVINSLNAAEAIVADGLREIAGILAADKLTQKLVSISDKESEEYKAALEEMKTRMKTATVEFWDSTPAFAQAVHNTMGPDMRDWMWAGVPKFCSHDIFITDLPDDQLWVVD